MPNIRRGMMGAAGVSADAWSGGELWTWGDNSTGTLGLGNTTDYSSPKQVGTDTNWLQINVGQYAYTGAAAIKEDGTLWTWGENKYGALGLGNTTAYSSPKQVGTDTDWLAVNMAGEWSGATLAFKTDGTLWAWGYSNKGQLGLGNTTSYSSPKQVGSLTDWSTSTHVMASGRKEAFNVLKPDGTLWTWGSGGNGANGLGNTTDYSSPKQIGTDTDWARHTTIAIASNLAVKTDGTAWVWGWGYAGFLGLGNTTNYSSPVQLGSLTNWNSDGALKATKNWQTGESKGVVVIKNDKTLWAWGYGAKGALGLGNTTSYSSPKQVGSLTTWYRIDNAYGSSSAITTSGELFTWGWNAKGQLGDGTTTDRSSPAQVGSDTNWVYVASGRALRMGLKTPS